MTLGIGDQPELGGPVRAELGHDDRAAELDGPGQHGVDVGDPHVGGHQAGGAGRRLADPDDDAGLRPDRSCRSHRESRC